MNREHPATPKILAQTIAWLVHLYTCLGLICGIYALWQTSLGEIKNALLWLLLAVVIDGTDGFLARKVKVAEHLPSIDGRKLDDIVDFFTYTIIPTWMMIEQGMLQGWEWVAGVVMISSLLGFAHTQAKREDNLFRGFPSYWNILFLYLWGFGTSCEFNAYLLLFCSFLVFVPLGYVYPSKTEFYQKLTLSLCVVWGLQLLLWLTLPSPPLGLLYSSLLFPLYYLLLSFYLNLKKPAKGTQDD